MGIGSTLGALGGFAIGGGAGASVGAGLGGLFDSNDSQKAAQDAAAQNMQLQMQHNAQVDPISASGARAGYASNLDSMLKGGASSSFNDPVFKAMQDQSMEATQRKMSAMGQGVGSNDMLALQSTAYGQANDFFGQQYNRLAQLANAGGGGTTTPQGMGPGLAGNFAGQTNTNMQESGGTMITGLQKMFGNGQQSQQNNPSLDYAGGYAPANQWNSNTGFFFN